MSREPPSSEQTAQTSETWGRQKDVGIFGVIFTGVIFLFSPLIVVYFWACLDKYNGSLFTPIYQLIEQDLTPKNIIDWGLNLFPEFSFIGIKLYGGWLLFHALAYLNVPSKIGYGQKTPAGYILPYRVNGFRIWLLTHSLYIIFSMVFPVFEADIIAKNWGSILIATNLYGFFLTFFSYFKALLFPSHLDDRKFSGSLIYDLFMGIELNPRIGHLDFKLFHNGRPGITAWTLINLSFAAAQFKQLGYVTNSMIVLNVLHATYVVDFFYYEDWYLRTIDIAHDHFGYYLAWGDSVWLPFMYTLQSFYLYRNPLQLSTFSASLILLLGFSGYYIFRNVNNQKDQIRKKNGKMVIWGELAEVIRAKYVTSDGEEHSSILLTSGYWGISRHFNYVGDLMMCLSFCLTCGFDDILPYFYFFYMIALLIHRVERDNKRCKGKYGKYWDLYCQKVPYKVIPYVY